jgi:hypothetical protein
MKWLRKAKAQHAAGAVKPHIGSPLAKINSRMWNALLTGRN